MSDRPDPLDESVRGRLHDLADEVGAHPAPVSAVAAATAGIRRRRAVRRAAVGGALAVVLAVGVPVAVAARGSGGAARVVPAEVTTSAVEPTVTGSAPVTEPPSSVASSVAPTPPDASSSSTPATAAVGPSTRAPVVAPTSPPSTAPPAAVPSCTAAELDAKAAPITVVDDDYREVVVLTSTANGPCTVEGVPTVSVVDQDGSVTTDEYETGDGTTGTDPVRSIEIAPGGSASFAIDLGRQEVSNDQQYCRPLASVRFTVPTIGAEQSVPVDGQRCSSPSADSTTVSPVVAGSAGPPVG